MKTTTTAKSGQTQVRPQQSSRLHSTPKSSPCATARLSPDAVKHLFDVWCAIDGVADVLEEDQETSGLAGALRITSRELGRIYEEAKASMNPAAAPAE